MQGDADKIILAGADPVARVVVERGRAGESGIAVNFGGVRADQAKRLFLRRAQEIGPAIVGIGGGQVIQEGLVGG